MELFDDVAQNLSSHPVIRAYVHIYSHAHAHARIHTNAGHSSTDVVNYKPKELVKAEQLNDPLPKLEAFLQSEVRAVLAISHATHARASDVHACSIRRTFALEHF